MRKALAVAVAGAIGFMPAVLTASPAQAAAGDVALVSNSDQVAEGGRLEFDLLRTGGEALEELTLTWTITGGITSDSAAPGTDENDVRDVSGEVTFPADTTAPFSNQTRTVVINTVDDALDEDIENLTVTISGAQAPLTATGKITDNDEAPGYRLVLDDPTPDETAGTVGVSATLLAPSGKDVTIPISTVAGTAKAGAEQDFVALSSSASLTVPAGDLDSAPVDVTINPDDVYEERQQTFAVRGGASDTVSGTQTTTVTIVDDEDQPEINVSQATAAEGSPLVFNVELSGPSERPVTATWATADGTGNDLTATEADGHGKALAGSDYTAGTGTVTFRAATSNTDVTPTTTDQTITVRTTQDTMDEDSPEDMNVFLTNPTIAKLGDDNVATGGITDNDDPPTVTLLPTNHTIVEGNGGRRAVTFTARLDRASGQQITVEYDTAEISSQAQQGADFITSSGKLRFNPGDTQKTFTVWVVGDTVHEADETFTVDLDSSTATVAAGGNEVVFTIDDDDALPTVNVAPVSVKEGNEGSVVVLPIRLSSPVGVNTDFDVTTTHGTATATGTAPGQTDYVAPATTVTVPAGQSTGYAYFLVNGDDVYEADETLSIAVEPDTTATNVTAGAKTARVTITNDDAAPSLSIVDADGEEGDDVQVTGLTNGVAQDDVALNVTFKGGSVNGSQAASAADFTDPGTTGVTIPGGALPGTTIDVGDPIELTDDTATEPAETIIVSGNGFGGAGSVTQGTLTIWASDGGTDPTKPGEPNQPGEPGEPGQAPKPTISAPARVTGAVAVSITGRVAPNAEVELWGAPIGGGDPQWIQNLKANATGNYAFSRWIGQGYRFITQSQEINSNEVRVEVTQAPVFVANSPSAGTISLAVQGNPRGAGQTVIVQRWVNNAWTNAWRGTTGANNQWRATARVASGTSLALRAFVAGDPSKGIYPGYTGVTRFTVR